MNAGSSSRFLKFSPPRILCSVSVARPRRHPAYFFQARRRYFIKNHGRVYAALADAGHILALALWKMRVLLTGHDNFDPPFYLSDSIRHSVFMTGFKLRNVENPTLASQAPVPVPTPAGDALRAQGN